MAVRDGKSCRRRSCAASDQAYLCGAAYEKRTRKHLCDQCRQLKASMFGALIFNSVRGSLWNPATACRLAEQHHASLAKARPAVSVETRMERLKVRYARAEALLFADVPQQSHDRALAVLREIKAEKRVLEVEARNAAVVALPAKDRILGTCQQLCERLDGLNSFDDRLEFLQKTVEVVETDGREFIVRSRVVLALANSGSKSRLRNTQVGHDGRPWCLALSPRIQGGL